VKTPKAADKSQHDKIQREVVENCWKKLL